MALARRASLLKRTLSSWMLRQAEMERQEQQKSSGQELDLLLVLDFEATCQERGTPSPQEVIEFPCLALDAKTGLLPEMESRFHRYVRPVAHPRLSAFCTELTGITQDVVDAGNDFSSTFSAFESWLAVTTEGRSFAFVTCGDWDLKTMLRTQCKYR